MILLFKPALAIKKFGYQHAFIYDLVTGIFTRLYSYDLITLSSTIYFVLGQLLNTTTTTINTTNPLVAMSKETASLRTYQLGKRMHTMRKQSFKLFHSRDVIKVVATVEKAVDIGHIKVRSDRPMWQDIG